MADIAIHLERAFGEDALRGVENAIAQLSPEDELTIRMAAVDAHEADDVVDVLERNHLDYQPKGSHDGDEYIITAKKMKG